MAPDLFSLQGLKNVGPTLREWRQDLGRVEERSSQPLSVRHFEPRGYIVQQHLARADRPVAAYDRWSGQIPAVFHQFVLHEDERSRIPATREDDPYCVGMIKHFASLVPLAQQARKPIFDLRQQIGVPSYEARNPEPEPVTVIVIGVDDRCREGRSIYFESSRSSTGNGNVNGLGLGSGWKQAERGYTSVSRWGKCPKVAGNVPVC